MPIQIWGLTAYPIWQDIIISTEGTTFAALSTADYTVEALTGAAGTNAVLLSTGRAVKRPGDTYLQVRVNDIISSCLKYPDLTLETPGADGWETPARYATLADPRTPALTKETGSVHLHGAAIPSPGMRFRLTWKDPGGVLANLAVSFVAYADAGGNFAFLRYEYYPGYMLSEPICALMDFRQWIMATVLKTSANGQGEGLTHLEGVIDFPAGSGGTFFVVGRFRPTQAGQSGEETGPVTVFLPLSTTENGEQYRILNTNGLYAPSAAHRNDPEYDYRFAFTFFFNEATSAGGTVRPRTSPVKADMSPASDIQDYFKAVESCARYCLYYVNSYGGWDWLLILGKSVETDAAVRTTIERRSPSALAAGNVRARGVEVIQAEVTKHLELHTHYLTDFQAARMHNLLNSPDVWVHDLEKNTIYPAVIRDGDCVHKTYKNQDHHLVSYQIDLDYAVTEMRR